jgi:carbonic anhydrase
MEKSYEKLIQGQTPDYLWIGCSDSRVPANEITSRHMIVCGHYGCGGIAASMTNTYHGYVDNRLRNIKDVYHKNSLELDAIEDGTQRANRLTELNVIEQVRNLAKTTIVQQAWAERDLHLHGWVYGLQNGLVKDLSVS